jgi:hypothetical protein
MSGKPKPYYQPKTKTVGQGRQGGGAPAPTRQSTLAPAGPWVCFSPGAGQWRSPSGQGILRTRPQAVYTTTTAPLYQSAPSATSPTWDNSALIADLNNFAMQQGGWVMELGASSHMTPDNGNLSHCKPLSRPHFVTVGNGAAVPIYSSGHARLKSSSGHSFKLNNIHLVPHLIHKLLSIRKFTRDNRCSIEFDSFGFSVKDLKTHREIIHCNSDGDLYTFPGASSRLASAIAFLATAPADLWHLRLGHPVQDAMSTLQHLSFIKCNKVRRSPVCHACHLSKQVRLPFSLSTSATSAIFELIHCYLWTYPIISTSDF